MKVRYSLVARFISIVCSIREGLMRRPVVSLVCTEIKREMRGRRDHILEGTTEGILGHDSGLWMDTKYFA
jgi:hypothetical protein